MKNKKGIILLIAVIAIIVLTIYLYTAILNRNSENKEKNIPVSNNNVNETAKNNIDEGNTVFENFINESNNEIENETENTAQNNVENTTTKPVLIDDVNGTTNYNSENGKEQAIALVKEDWGKDESVYFFVDSIDKNGKAVVTVRNKSTTNEVVRYNVDVKAKTVELQ